jgi:hypothetical protein
MSIRSTRRSSCFKGCARDSDDKGYNLATDAVQKEEVQGRSDDSEKNSGAVKAKVREPLHARNDLVLVAEFEAWPEPKTLSPAALRALMDRFGGSYGAAEVIGASEAFVRQNGWNTRVRGKTLKR